jgi:hypothetical protein
MDDQVGHGASLVVDARASRARIVSERQRVAQAIADRGIMPP